MGTIAEKLTYLNNTKQLLKDAINDLGGNIDNETTFREYVDNLAEIYNDYPKISDTGTSINLTDTKKGKMLINLNPSEISQDGTPAPETPLSIHTINGNNTITIDEGNEEEQNYSINLSGLEYCKIGTYKDQIFKNTINSPYYDNTLNENEWYMKKNIKKALLKPTNVTLESNGIRMSDYSVGIPVSTYPQIYCNYFRKASNYGEAVGGLANSININASGIPLCNVSGYTSTSQYLALFNNNDIYLYFPLATPEYINITSNYPTLATQLENLSKNAKSYDDETNISQTNNDLSFDITAYALEKGV